MRWTEQQLAEYQARVDGALAARPPPPDTSNPPFKLPNNDAGAFALGRLPPGTMNKTEVRYAAYLADLQSMRQVLWFKFEGIKLRLARDTFLTVDFAVLPASGVLEMHEVKGHWQDDARAKIKVAASIYPFRFIAVTARALKRGGGWEREEF